MHFSVDALPEPLWLGTAELLRKLGVAFVLRTEAWRCRFS